MGIDHAKGTDVKRIVSWNLKVYIAICRMKRSLNLGGDDSGKKECEKTALQLHDADGT